MPADGSDCRLIARVDVGSLVAVHLDRNEVLVDEFGHLGIVIRFSIHYVTPVTPDGADIQQDGFVVTFGLRESGFAPLMPVDRLVHRRSKIGRRRLPEIVGYGRTHKSSLRQSKEPGSAAGPDRLCPVFYSEPRYFCRCASRNQRSLSASRVICVKRSEVPLSPRSSVRSMSFRNWLAALARRSDSAET